MLRLCSLGSGSGGNGLVVEASDGHTSSRVLVDNGFNLRQLSRRLERVGLDIAALDAVFVTHEHSDHAAGIRRLALKHGIAVYCTAGTAAACDFDALGVAWIRVEHGVAVEVGALRIEPLCGATRCERTGAVHLHRRCASCRAVDRCRRMFGNDPRRARGTARARARVQSRRGHVARRVPIRYS